MNLREKVKVTIAGGLPQSVDNKSMSVVSTPRAVLRRFCKADVDSMIAVFGDPDVMRFGDGKQDTDWIRQWIEKTAKCYDQWGFGRGPSFCENCTRQSAIVVSFDSTTSTANLKSNLDTGSQNSSGAAGLQPKWRQPCETWRVTSSESND
ncbi:MAG: GNAT family N-acetyltransferase [Fuerstiella sp.]